MLAFILRPVVFFRRRVEREPRWWLAAAGPLSGVALQLAASVLLTARLQAPLESLLDSLAQHRTSVAALRALALLGSATGYLAGFAVAAIAVVCIDIVAVDSGRATRLIECTGLAFFTQLPYGLLLLAGAAVWSPPRPRTWSGMQLSNITAVAASFRADLLDDPFLSTMRLISVYCLVWLVGMLGACLYAVSGVTKPAAVAASAGLLVLFGLTYVNRPF